MQEAKRLELDRSKEAIRTQDELNRKILAELLIKKVVNSSLPSQEELYAKYKEFLKTAPKFEYKIRHIVLPTRRKAFEIMQRLKKGEDFSLLATESLEKGTADRGGELGWINSQNLVLSALSLVEKLKPSQVGGPILSSLGWEVIELLAVRPYKIPSFEELKPALIQQIQQENLKKHVQELVSSGQVQIFPLPITTANP
ncbi:peptidylprolyl isomerase [Methylacidiphilum caldifontis]|uniref:peptidylprolyl isomerase n=1 Tax=Methylacidiphilum caldifontis TaxID=2795386 RepID=UPI001A8DC4C9|nr:peptidylprolyl isomerase [Methylacidiphilum caldifontis]QSR88123.1 peptidylprolyl isomerase [Methylacidiphilum caldifontis]